MFANRRHFPAVDAIARLAVLRRCVADPLDGLNGRDSLTDDMNERC
jgi:hypothetical protein